MTMPNPAYERQLTEKFLREHYATWPEIPLPALGGKKPRDAIRTPEGRHEVESLIRDMEARNHGTPMDGSYDFDDLRRALGLSPSRGPLG